MYKVIPVQDLTLDIIPNQETDFSHPPYRKYQVYRKIITLDTETSQYNDEILFITDWTLTIEDVGCIYGHRVQDLMYTLQGISEYLDISQNRRLYIWVHNFSYDYMFMRNHLLETFGKPCSSLSTRPHKYITMRFDNGMEFRDSYILTGRSLEKFVKDMGTEVQKKTGAWDYEKFRTPGSSRTPEEVDYAVSDTIALTQGLREFFRQHKCNTASVQLTNTGFVRKAGLDASKTAEHWRKQFRASALTADQYILLEDCFHGGYTHANRYYVGRVMRDVISYDFTSSYPARMIYNKFPMKEFRPYNSPTMEAILSMSDVFAFFGHVLLYKVELDPACPMPPIQVSKCKILRSPVIDNGRVISAAAVLFPFTDPDLENIVKYYSYSRAVFRNVWWTEKDYLPDWFCSLIMELFRNKSTLKGKDNVLYMLSKGMLNSMYGMSVQKIIPTENEEIWQTGQWITNDKSKDPVEAQKYLNSFYNNRKKFLPYQWGVWVTAYAQQELFRLGECCETWIYSDTDSVKGIGWNLEKLHVYNDEIRQQAAARGYGSLTYEGREFTLGVADFDGSYEEFVTLGSKRYCVREEGKLKITVAGVPKVGAEELEDDIRKFRKDMIFRNTNKMASAYIYHEGIKHVIIDGEDIEYGCAIRLDPVEYTLDQTLQFDPRTGKPYTEFDY